jgi:hypothetical protein
LFGDALGDTYLSIELTGSAWPVEPTKPWAAR